MKQAEIVALIGYTRRYHAGRKPSEMAPNYVQQQFTVQKAD